MTALSPAAEWTLRERYKHPNGMIAYDIWGDGPPLVLVHGTPSWSYLWRNVAPRLARRWRVYVYDLPGFGLSEKFEGQDVSLAKQADVLGDLLDHWGLERPRITGHDTGGTIVLRSHLLDGRQFERIALIDALALRPEDGGRWGTPWSLYLRDHGKGALPLLPAYIQRAILRAYVRTAMATPQADLALEPYLRPWMGEVGQAAFYRQIEQLDVRYTDEIEPTLSETQGPVRILWGEEDTWLEPEMALRLRDAIPEAELRFISNAGHFVQEDAPGAVSLALESFFDEATWSSSTGARA